MSEDKITHEKIDILASEYSWTIEYIQELDMGEINDLIDSINKRKESEYRLQSYITALAFSGKTLDDITKAQNYQTENVKKINPTEKEIKKTKENEKNMVKLFNLLGMSPIKVAEGIKQGKMEV